MARVTTTIFGLDALTRVLSLWNPQMERNMERAFKDIVTEWARQAKLRVPVETGRLRNTILTEVGKDAQGLYGAVGSNLTYSPFVEFGTDRIAGGAVKALGTRPDITDAEAVTDWPAKAADGAQREQMPWLRPAFMAIRDKSERRIARAIEPPK